MEEREVRTALHYTTLYLQFSYCTLQLTFVSIANLIDGLLFNLNLNTSPLQLNDLNDYPLE